MTKSSDGLHFEFQDLAASFSHKSLLSVAIAIDCTSLWLISIRSGPPHQHGELVTSTEGRNKVGTERTEAVCRTWCWSDQPAVTADSATRRQRRLRRGSFFWWGLLDVLLADHLYRL